MACQRWYPGTVSETPQDSIGCRLYHTAASNMIPAGVDPELDQQKAGLCRIGSRSGGETCVLPP